MDKKHKELVVKILQVFFLAVAVIFAVMIILIIAQTYRAFH